MHWLLQRAIAGVALLCFATPAHAIDPLRMISQYMRERWGSERGFPGGAVSTIAQTTDGYLWIGTERGLVRFDGLNFRLFQQASPGTFPVGPVQGLVADAEANLWVLLKNTKIYGTTTANSNLVGRTRSLASLRSAGEVMVRLCFRRSPTALSRTKGEDLQSSHLPPANCQSRQLPQQAKPLTLAI